MAERTREDLSTCLAACQAALQACQECAASDLGEGDPKMWACALINLDCADICEATIKALARRSPHHGDFCAICEHLCRACASECAKHDTEHCRRCKEACIRCAAACSQHAGERHALPK